jgi:hypothetical protein
MRRFAPTTILAVFLPAGCARTSQAPKQECSAAKDFESEAGMGAVHLYRLGRAVGETCASGQTPAMRQAPFLIARTITVAHHHRYCSVG